MRSPEDSGSAGNTGGNAKRRSRKGMPPSSSDTLGALAGASRARVGKKGKKPDKIAKARSKKRTRPLNFRVTPAFRRAFKQEAAARDCKKVELLERIFAEWGARGAG